MRLRTRLVLNIALASLVPLCVLGVGAVQIAADILLGQVSEMQAVSARSLAVEVDTWADFQLTQIVQHLKTFDVAGLEGESLNSFPRLVYQQTAGAGIVSLTNRSGAEVVPSVFLAPGIDPTGSVLSVHPTVDDARFRLFRAALPFADLARPRLPWGVAIGRPYEPDEESSTVLPLAIAVSGRDWVLGVELSLSAVEAKLTAHAKSGVQVALLNEEGDVVIGGDPGWVDPRAFRPFLGQTEAEAVRYEIARVRDEDLVEIIAACAPVPALGWTVVVAEPVQTATAPVQEIWERIAYVLGVSVVFSLLLGVLFARTLSKPMVELTAAALAVAKGELGRTVKPIGQGELAELGQAFNFMSKGLAQNATELRKKNAEIHAFSQVLQGRVDEATHELHEAQGRLVQSARLAAVGEMGAGLAHELNNPIAGILGLTQVLIARSEEGGAASMLRSIEEQALRCKQIVSHLLGFSSETNSGSVDPVEPDVVDLHLLLLDVLSLMGSALRQRGIVVNIDFPGGLCARGDRADLGRAFAQLLTSLRGAVGAGAQIDIVGTHRDLIVEIDINVTAASAPEAETPERESPERAISAEGAVGKGIEIGGDDWNAAGLGFWAASRVFTDAGGSLIEPKLEPGQMARSALWRVLLPEG